MLDLVDFVLAAALIGLIVWAGYQANAISVRKGYFNTRKMGKTRKNHRISKTQSIVIAGLAGIAVFIGGLGMVCLLFNGSF